MVFLTRIARAQLSALISAQLFDPREFARFFATGLLATLGNVSAVWLAASFMRYRWALLLGVSAGFVISFFLGKFFAFKSHDLDRTGLEAMRFTVVYSFGAALYWCVAMLFGLYILPRFIAAQYTLPAGALFGASTMLFTSYFGHRLFTYRSPAKDS